MARRRCSCYGYDIPGVLSSLEQQRTRSTSPTFLNTSEYILPSNIPRSVMIPFCDSKIVREKKEAGLDVAGTRTNLPNPIDLPASSSGSPSAQVHACSVPSGPFSNGTAEPSSGW